MTYSIIKKWSLATDRSKLGLFPFRDKVQVGLYVATETKGGSCQRIEN